MLAADWGWGWGAVEAIATGVAAVAAIVAGVFGYRAFRDAQRTITAQQKMLQIEQERWVEERHDRFAESRRIAAQLRVETELRLDCGIGGVVMTICNDADVAFDGIVVDHDSEHSEPDREEASTFAWFVGTLEPGERYDREIPIPTGVMWRVRYYDIGMRRWVRTVFDEIPHRLLD